MQEHVRDLRLYSKVVYLYFFFNLLTVYFNRVKFDVKFFFFFWKKFVFFRLFFIKNWRLLLLEKKIKILKFLFKHRYKRWRIRKFRLKWPDDPPRHGKDRKFDIYITEKYFELDFMPRRIGFNITNRFLVYFKKLLMILKNNNFFLKKQVNMVEFLKNYNNNCLKLLLKMRRRRKILFFRRKKNNTFITLTNGFGRVLFFITVGRYLKKNKLATKKKERSKPIHIKDTARILMRVMKKNKVQVLDEAIIKTNYNRFFFFTKVTNVLRRELNVRIKYLRYIEDMPHSLLSKKKKAKRL